MKEYYKDKVAAVTGGASEVDWRCAKKCWPWMQRRSCASDVKRRI